jgi:hypothetical protein
MTCEFSLSLGKFDFLSHLDSDVIVEKVSLLRLSVAILMHRSKYPNEVLMTTLNYSIKSNQIC